MALTQISTAGVKDDAVTSGKIPANAVGSSELADNAVDTAAIADGAVTAGKLASGVQTTINNNADNRVITGSGTANTLNGEARLTFNGSLLTVSGYNDDNPVILDTDNGNGAHMRFQQQGSTKHYLGCGGGISMGNANQLSMRSTDHIHFGTGNSSTIRASFLNGGGLSFNGDTAAANALDDYEEGTFTPTVSAGTTNTQTFDQNGRYTKIGRMVYVEFLLQYSGAGTSAHMQFSGLPFTSANNTSRGGGTVLWTNIPGLSDAQALAAIVEQNATTLKLYRGMDSNASTGSGGFTNKAIYIRVTYEAA
jgi:hypothetical protein